jgi:hypothetical protein
VPDDLVTYRDWQRVAGIQAVIDAIGSHPAALGFDR